MCIRDSVVIFIIQGLRWRYRLKAYVQCFIISIRCPRYFLYSFLIALALTYNDHAQRKPPRWFFFSYCPFLFQLFLNCLCNLQNHSILTEIDTERLFCNIPEIYSANRVFWQENIRPMVKVSQETGEPLDPDMMLEGFTRVRRSPRLPNTSN